MMRRARGFTIVELLISLGLAGILVAGAFQIHTVFNAQTMRQNQINEVQQSLRLTMGMIERAVRNSGAGLTNGKALINPGCGGQRAVYRVQYYNSLASTAWPPPGTTGATALFDSTPLDKTTNPDMLRIVSPLSTTGLLATADTGSVATVVGILPQQLLNNDFLLFLNNASSTTPTAYGCLRQITNGPFAATATVATTLIGHGPGVGSQCVNNDTSCSLLLGPPLINPTEVRVLRNQTFFRIMPAPGGGFSTKLGVLVTGIGDPPAQPTWSVVADDIEDMQIALLMSNGVVCNDMDDPVAFAGQCDPSQAVALRVTLTGVTLSTANGMTTTTVGGGGPISQKMGYEDTLPVTPSPPDGLIRRSLTSEIILRN